jgi:hypothetical protein
MPPRLVAWLLPAVISLTPSGARAQPRAKVYIDDVRVGFSAALEPGEIGDERGRASLYKPGFWTPVFVQVRAGAEGVVKGRLLVETADSDDVANVYSVPLPPAGLEPNETFTALAYAKPGSLRSDFVIRVEADNRSAEVKKAFDALGAADALCLTLGSRLNGLKQALAPQANPDNPSPVMERQRVASVDDVRALPHRWYGYTAADVVILTTGDRKFVDNLLQADPSRKQALADWVRRGGHLVISCGSNRDQLAELFRRLQIPLPVTVTGPLPVAGLDPLRTWVSGQQPFSAGAATLEEGARLERRPGEEYEPLLPARADEQVAPLVLRWPYGTGQVTLVAFDLDRPPFTTWVGQADFWKVLLPRCGVKPPAKPSQSPKSVSSEDRGVADLASDLQKRLDQFEDVSVISFGWVAVFILIYIIVVGPLDYLFLKKVVKRLELTWITFPTVVLVVSVGAYVTAYALKGNDLKINKVDLVDIDLAGQRAYGTTWFTLFSPRIQLYTVGIEPAAPLWALAPEGDAAATGVVVSWLGKPEQGFGGYARPRSQSLFRRTYEYAPDAAGLTSVPIQVWTSKAFTASWERPFRSDRPAPRLRRRQSASGVEGTLTNPLPVTLEDAALVYGESESQAKAYLVGTLVPGQSKPLVAVKDVPLSQWLTGEARQPEATVDPGLMRRIMFYDASANPEGLRDRALYALDQSWRRSWKGGAILVGRAARAQGPAEPVSQDPASASCLWLGRLPGSGEPRPVLAGTLTQDTYVRVFLPVASPAEEEK